MTSWPVSVALRLVAALSLLIAAGCGPTGQAGACEGSAVECGSECVDTSNDPGNCGGCGVTCDTAAGQSCVAGECVAPVVCEPGTTEACYDGPLGTEGVGTCTGGTRTCSPDGTAWSYCVGQVLPVGEICDNGLDDDCNGLVDDVMDLDGDGWTSCDGDCCDTPADGCTEPALVNPGAYDAIGNNLDDDCDGVIDNPMAMCDSGLPSASSDPLQYAAAMELCQTTTESPPLDQLRWGVIDARFVRADGTGSPNANQRSIRPGFGTGNPPLAGSSLAVLSTGHAADSSDTSPNYAAFQGGQDLGSSSAVPSDWLAANGGDLPNAPGCPEPQGGTTAYDPIMLELRIRVPTNARSFSFNSNFFSSEYPEWVCSPYNDFFVVLLDSAWDGQPANPADKNLATYTSPQSVQYPVGVNLAFGDTGLFTECLNGPTGCGGGSVAGTTSTCTSTAGLAGTGMDVANPPAQFGNDPGWCGASNLTGGGTGWLTTRGNVVGGEIITLRIAVWDTGDPWYDSVVLLDNFQWSVEVAEPGTVID
jgi:hypothetical protein